MSATRLLVLAASLPLAGCNTASPEDIRTATPTPRTAEFSEAFSAFGEDYVSIQALPQLLVPPASGTGAFDGELALDLTGDAVGTALADLGFTIDFTAGNVSGGAEHFVLAFENGDMLLLQGTLVLEGKLVDVRLSGQLTGQLLSTDPSYGGVLEAALSLSGILRGLADEATGVTGTAAGRLQGDRILEVTTGAFFVQGR